MDSNTSRDLIETLTSAVHELRQQTDALSPEDRQSLIAPLERISQVTASLRPAAMPQNESEASFAVIESANQARQQAETALYEAQEQLRVIFENIRDYAIFTLDLDRRITTWNTGAERIFGFREAEIIGQKADILFTLEDRMRDEPAKEQQQAIETGYGEDERWHLRKDGSRFFASGILRPILNQDGNLEGFIKVARDITARHEAEISERKRRIMAEALRDIATVLTSTLNLDQVLEHVLTMVGRLVPHEAAYLLLLDQGVITRVRTLGQNEHGLAELETMLRQHRLHARDIPLFQQILQTKAPLIVLDFEREETAMRIPLTPAMRSYLGTPILVEDEVIGLLNVMSDKPGFFDDDHAETLQLFAYEAAIAIRNAQLYLQAQELAALEERQRLARDLHDAVTQTLFSASILTETLSRQYHLHPERVPHALSELHQLIKAALAEMRTLLLQLRPPAILNTRLDHLLRQLITAMHGRRRMTIEFDTEGDFLLPPDAHIALYRIAQEGLNNIIKHSKAKQVTINLMGNGNRVELRLQDNGRGFNPDERFSGLGLQMMRERAEAIGATFEIESKTDRGTKIRVVWNGAADVNDQDR